MLVTRSDGTVWHDANVINDNTLGDTGPGSAMSQGWGWNESILSNYPLGTYTYTFTIDPDNTVDEKGDIYVVDWGNNRIQALHLDSGLD